MKRTIFIGACLVLFNLTSLKATTLDSIYTATEGTVNPKSVTTKLPTKKLEAVKLIPYYSLNVELSKDEKFLVVNLDMETPELLDWIIMEKGGELVSRVKTAQSIDEIKVSKLTKGEYVLMIKDAEGRMLYDTFVKS